MKSDLINTDPLIALKQFTDARIAIGRVGDSIPIKESLEFKLAHAHARDAVYSVLDFELLNKRLAEFNLPILSLHSKAFSRHNYLKRPDYGRQLNDKSINELKDYNNESDIAIIIADGLSATAINENAPELLRALIPMLISANFTIGPLCLVEQARVAIGDEVGFYMKAKYSIVLIGERPGLSAADSLGAYLTYCPKPGLTDESRNCVSNIRLQGLNYKLAAEKIFYLVSESFKLKLSGIIIKDNNGLINQ